MANLVFVHGLDNKPEPDYLFKLWKRKLGHDDGFDLDTSGVTSCMNYWADVLYESPDTNLAAYESAMGDIEGLGAGPEKLNELPHKNDERLRNLARRLDVDPETVEENQPTEVEVAAVREERVPVPAWLRKRIMARFVRDAHHYFFNMEFNPRPGPSFRVREELRRRFVECLKQGATQRPLVVLSHSMGTIIAYDCLMHEPECPPIDGLMTVGSPLGLDEVQDFFPSWSRSDGFPAAKLNGPWVNVFDPLDAVACADPWISNDYQRGGYNVVEDLREDNWGTWRHSISKYLQGKQLRDRLAKMLKVDWP
jgi:hypothetical protein